MIGAYITKIKNAEAIAQRYNSARITHNVKWPEQLSRKVFALIKKFAILAAANKLAIAIQRLELNSCVDDELKIKHK